MNAALVLVWLVIAFGLGRRFAQLAGGRQAERGELARAVR